MAGKKDKKERRKKNEEKMTRLLITIMISFTLLTSPSCIYAIIDFNYNKGSIGGVMESLGINHRLAFETKRNFPE